MKHSWFFQNGLYYTLLALVILFHIILLAIRYQQNLKLTEVDQRPLKIRIVDGPSQVKNKKQIVQSDDPKDFERPSEKSFLSDRDRKFDRQSKARTIDKFNSETQDASAADSRDIKLSDLGAFSKDHHPLKESVKKKSHEIRPQVSSTNDFLEDIPLGDLTYLNTVEYKYYGFYHRIRQKLEQFWGRSIQEKAEDILKEGRRLASEDNLITSLQVTLNEMGEIVEIKINGTSGIQELDDAAVESFNQAGPFPNPPKDLVQNGRVEIEWGFVVNT